MNTNDNPANESMIRSNEGGVWRYSVIDGKETFTHEGVDRSEESISADAKRRGGFDFQVTSQDGRVVSPGRGVKDSDLVKIPMGNGKYCETTIGNAVRQGLVGRNEQGSYVFDEAEIAKELAPPQQQQQSQEPTGEAFADTAAQGLLRAVATDVDPSDHVAVFRELSDTGTVSPSLIGRIASQLQVSPADASQYVSKILGAFEKQAHGAIRSVTGGHIDSTEILDWAKQNAPRELHEAFESQFKNRSTKAYKALAQKYVLGLEKSDPAGVMQIAQDAGLQPRHEKSAGVVVLTFPNGQSMTFGQALQMGLINLTGKGR